MQELHHVFAIVVHCLPQSFVVASRGVDATMRRKFAQTQTHAQPRTLGAWLLPRRTASPWRPPRIEPRRLHAVLLPAAFLHPRCAEYRQRVAGGASATAWQRCIVNDMAQWRVCAERKWCIHTKCAAQSVMHRCDGHNTSFALASRRRWMARTLVRHAPCSDLRARLKQPDKPCAFHWILDGVLQCSFDQHACTTITQ